MTNNIHHPRTWITNNNMIVIRYPSPVLKEGGSKTWKKVDVRSKKCASKIVNNAILSHIFRIHISASTVTCTTQIKNCIKLEKQEKQILLRYIKRTRREACACGWASARCDHFRANFRPKFQCCKITTQATHGGMPRRFDRWLHKV